MAGEHVSLCLARRMHVVVIEADLADGHHLWSASQSLDFAEGDLVAILRLMGMKPHCSPHVVIFLGEVHRLRRVFEIRPRHDKSAHTLLARSREICGGVGHGEMAVRICESQRGLLITPERRFYAADA